MYESTLTKIIDRIQLISVYTVMMDNDSTTPLFNEILIHNGNFDLSYIL